MPSFDGSDDFLRVFGPGKRLWSLIMLGQVTVDGGLEIDNALEHAALEPAPGKNSKKSLDSIKPGGGCRREVEGEARVACQPGHDFRVLVSGIIVEDYMDDLADRNR